VHRSGAMFRGFPWRAEAAIAAERAKTMHCVTPPNAVGGGEKPLHVWRLRHTHCGDHRDAAAA
jgi:hypothetical protein